MNRPKAIADILRETKMMKAAAAAKVAELAGMDPESMPGAEHDKPAPKDAEEPDPQVADGTMGPDSARSAEGAGDDRPITAGSLFEADEAVLNPEKKPMESADANAKVAEYSKLGNEFLRMAQDFIKEKTAASAPKAKEAEAPKAKEAAPAAKEAEAAKPAEAPKAEAKEAAIPDVTKAGEGLNIEFSQDILTKLACYMLAEEEGAALAERVLTKIAGEEASARTMDYLAKQAAYAEQADAYQRGYEARMAQIAAVKQAEAARANEYAAAYANQADAYQRGYNARMAQIAAIKQAEEDAAAAAAGAADAEADLAGAAGGGEENIDMDTALEAIQAGVNSGEISPEQGQELISELLSDAEGGAAGGEEEIDPETLAEDIQSAMDSGELPPEAVDNLIQELASRVDPEVLSAIEQEISGAEGGGAAAAEAEGAAAADAAPAEAAAAEGAAAADADAAAADAGAAAEAAGAEAADADIAKAAAAQQKAAAARSILNRVLAKGRTRR